MKRFSEGDRVRIDIPDENDPDYGEYHRQHGKVVDIISDDAASMTGDERDAFIYRVELDSGVKADFRWRDLRPSNTDE